MMHYLKNGAPVAEAYFADNDWIAVGAMRALKESGYLIPEQISIIGFDDLPICTITEPPLTTMEVPKKLLGKLAVEQLLKKINHSTDEIIKVELSPRIQQRQSVKENR